MYSPVILISPVVIWLYPDRSGAVAGPASASRSLGCYGNCLGWGVLKKNATTGLNAGWRVADGWDSAASGGGTPQPDTQI